MVTCQINNTASLWTNIFLHDKKKESEGTTTKRGKMSGNTIYHGR